MKVTIDKIKIEGNFEEIEMFILRFPTKTILKHIQLKDYIK